MGNIITTVAELEGYLNRHNLDLRLFHTGGSWHARVSNRETHQFVASAKAPTLYEALLGVVAVIVADMER